MAIALGCGGESGDTSHESMVGDDSKLMVVAVNYPLAYMAERIGGGLVRVDYPIPDGIDPAFWQPTPEDIGHIQDADIILLNGAGYAKWTATATLPASRIIVTSEAVEDRYLAVVGSVEHTHGPDGEHSHGEVTFTTWLDPTIAIAQATAVAEALKGLRPAERETIQTNLEGLIVDLEALDRELADAFDRFPSRAFFASHPVYQYLARRYDLQLSSVHFEPDEAPSEQAWSDLERMRARGGANVMLWEAEPLPQTRERLASMGLQLVLFSTAGSLPDSGDYFSVMRDNVSNLRQARLGVDSP
ncbi:MAG: metal ABC transporter substrate-binding protein [Gemmatimonadetes bacterium]|nr:metal ABC transporter substrate-binding protein [Gemmatimonadota bacterium]